MAEQRTRWWLVHSLFINDLFPRQLKDRKLKVPVMCVDVSVLNSSVVEVSRYSKSACSLPTTLQVSHQNLKVDLQGSALTLFPTYGRCLDTCRVSLSLGGVAPGKCIRAVTKCSLGSSWVTSTWRYKNEGKAETDKKCLPS